MKIEMWPIGRVTPYENNPRINDAAVDAVAFISLLASTSFGQQAHPAGNFVYDPLRHDSHGRRPWYNHAHCCSRSSGSWTT